MPRIVAVDASFPEPYFTQAEVAAEFLRVAAGCGEAVRPCRRHRTAHGIAALGVFTTQWLCGTQRDLAAPRDAARPCGGRGCAVACGSRARGHLAVCLEHGH